MFLFSNFYRITRKKEEGFVGRGGIRWERTN